MSGNPSHAGGVIACASCFCFEARNANTGVCHRNPPTAVVGPANRVMAPGAPEQLGTAGIWPPVKPDDWCAWYLPANGVSDSTAGHPGTLPN